MRKKITLFDDQYAFYKELKSEKLLVAFVEFMFEDIDPVGFNNMEQIVWNSLLPRMEKLKAKIDAGSEGGRISHGGGATIGNQNAKKTTSKTTSKKTTKQQANDNQDKDKDKDIRYKIKEEDKVEDNKKNKFLDFVYLSEEEYSKLTERFGKAGADERIDRLNSYLGSTGKKYKSHYFTILSWSKNDTGTTTQTNLEQLKERERQRIREEAKAILSPKQNQNGQSIQTEGYNRRTNFKSS